MAMFLDSTRSPIVQSEGRATTVPTFEGMVAATMPSEGVPVMRIPSALPEIGDLKSGDTALLPPAPLPSLISAFSRRRALFGAVALAAAPGAALQALAAPVPADPLLDLLERSTALIAYGQTLHVDDPNADEPADQALALLHKAFDLRATTPAGALASLQWARDEFARYYVTEKEDDDPDWMDRLTLNMLDSALGTLRPLVEGGHHA